MNLIELRQESDLMGLQSSWDALLAGSSSGTIFLTWEWISSWWAAYGRTGDLRLLAAIDDQGVLRGVAPLRADHVRRYGQTVPSLSFVGDGSNDSDYLDFLIGRGYETEVMECFGAYLRAELNRGTLLQLREIPANSPNLEPFRRFTQAEDYLYRESQTACATIPLPSTWEEYLASLKPRFRTKIRSVLRSLENRPEVRFVLCEDREQLERLLPILFELHTKRWTREGQPGVFGWDSKREFYHTISPLLLSRNWLRFSWIEWNGRILACQYGFEYRGSYLQLQEGYEPAAEHLHIGTGLRAWSIRQYLLTGLREYDFLGGVSRHKLDWGAVEKPSTNVLAAKSTLKNSLVIEGPEWQSRTKERIRKFIPANVLAARDALRKSRQSETGVASAADGWPQKIAAKVYFHSRLSALVRPLRDQFQVSLAADDGRRRFSCNKRTETTGRILYYHRVNDDGDPFFPAISTSLFQAEMRYVARHYKVVSLSGLLEHLESGATETALAITFDDGYEDNYTNAFPILQRYGLPATIFLSTGSMDSREPLWFEHLALALKTTAKECLDLDIDIPRRFWLRNQQERLDANSELLALLRDLPDGERRRWCAEIIRELEVIDAGERRGKMLNWEQVRLMSAHGMTFGGHTVDHPFISKLTKEQTIWEVSECKRRIQQELQSPTEFFAYPSGREQDFGLWNKELVRQAGYRAAVTTIWGTNYRTTDPMELRRGGPWDDNAAQFAYKLDWYQLVND